MKQFLVCLCLIHASLFSWASVQNPVEHEIEIFRASNLLQEKRMRYLGGSLIANGITVVAGTAATLRLNHQAIKFSTAFKIISATGAAVALVGAAIYYLHSGHPHDLTSSEVQAILSLSPQQRQVCALNPRYAGFVHSLNQLIETGGMK